MIKSMTGFGRCEAVCRDITFTVEIKSVNHRYLDVNIKLPKKFAYFETSVRTALKQHISRGKVDVFITYEDLGENAARLSYNRDLAAEYLKYLRQMAQEFELKDDISVSALSKFPDVFQMAEQAQDSEEIWKDLQKAIDGAAEAFTRTRMEEGEHLGADLREKLDGMLKLVELIEARSPRMVEEYRDRLEEKVKELLEGKNIEESRILTEVTIFADKACVDEELVRLRSHIEATKKTLAQGGGIGRKLDFLAQEMNREANTILAKCNDLEIAGHGIELKTEIEKVREQIQNIE